MLQKGQTEIRTVLLGTEQQGGLSRDHEDLKKKSKRMTSFFGWLAGFSL